METLALLAEGSRISSLKRVKGHKEETILTWWCEAAQHAAQGEEGLMTDFHEKRGQLDALWTDVRNKRRHMETDTSGQFWRFTYLDVESCLRMARGMVKDETQASIDVFRTMQRRGHPDAPSTLSDGCGGIGHFGSLWRSP